MKFRPGLKSYTGRQSVPGTQAGIDGDRKQLQGMALWPGALAGSERSQGQPHTQAATRDGDAWGGV